MKREDLPEACCRLLDAMAWLETKRIAMPWSRVIVAYLANYRPRAGFFKEHVGILKKNGFVSFPAPFHLALEHGGRLLAQAPTDELTLTLLHLKIVTALTWQTHAVMVHLLAAYPNRVERAALAGLTAMNPDDLANAIASLHRTGLAILPDRQTIVADPVIYPKELL